MGMVKHNGSVNIRFGEKRNLKANCGSNSLFRSWSLIILLMVSDSQQVYGARDRHSISIWSEDGDVGRTMVFFLVEDCTVVVWVLVCHVVFYLSSHMFGVLLGSKVCHKLQKKWESIVNTVKLSGCVLFNWVDTDVIDGAVEVRVSQLCAFGIGILEGLHNALVDHLINYVIVWYEGVEYI